MEGLAWRFGFVGAMLVNLKQANPVLLALVTAGLILVALRDPAIRTRRALLQLPRMLGPGIVLIALWRWYVMQNLPNSEQAFRPFDTWNFGVLRQTFAAIGGLIADAPLFHSMMWLVTAAGVVFFFQLPRKASEARWLAVVCATVWLGYNVFLLIIYLGVMTVSDAHMAADYWRYTPHVALLGLYAPVMALAIARWPAWMNLRSAVPTLAVVLLALCAMPMRSDLNNPPGRAWQRFLRDAAADMRHVIPPGSKVLIVPFWNSIPFGVAVRYNLWQLDMPEQQIVATILWEEDDFAKVASWAARGEADYLIIQDAEGMMDKATDTLGLPRLNHELVLFVWRDGAWERVKSWPVPPPLILPESRRWRARRVSRSLRAVKPKARSGSKGEILTASTCCPLRHYRISHDTLRGKSIPLGLICIPKQRLRFSLSPNRELKFVTARRTFVNANISLVFIW